MNERITPNLDSQDYKTFQISAPKETHQRPASCAEVDCDMAEHGWQMKIDLGTELGQKQAYYIKHHSGRRYVVVEQRDGLVTLNFPGGQECFREHSVSVERDPNFLVKGGDWRGNPLNTPTRVHTRPEHWVEEFAENQDRLKTAIERG
jgi:hypothetical protein